jgi:hypothetical protein
VKRFTHKRLKALKDSTGQRAGSIRMQPAVRSHKKELTTFNIILLLVVAAAVLVGYVSNVMIVNHLGIKIHRCEETEKILLLEKENLQADLQGLCNRTRIESYATSRLGLIPADHRPQVLYVPGLEQEEK